MKGIELIKEYKISLVNLTPLKIGNGKDKLDLLIDKNTQNPIILGSSIAGAVKNYLMDLKLTEDVNKYLGKEEESKNERESQIYIADAYGSEFKISSRTGIRRSYKYGTSEENSKYDIDFIDSDTEFELNFKLFAKSQSELNSQDELMKKVIEGFKGGNLRLGANKMSGFGTFAVKKVEFRKLDLSKREDLIAYIMDNKIYTTLSLDEFKERGNKGYIEFDFKGSIIDSMIIKQYQIKENEVDCKNMTNSKDESIIPGTTIKGVFREYNTKILKTLGLDKKLFLIENIYGTAPNTNEKNHFIGNVLTSDVIVKNAKYCTYNRIRVDRFTGGVLTGGKFDEQRVQGDLNFKISLKKLEKNNKAAVGLILFTFRDLGLSKIPIGSSSSIGAGRIKGSKLTIKDDDKIINIKFEDEKVICDDINYVNEAIDAIKNIEKPEKNRGEAV